MELKFTGDALARLARLRKLTKADDNVEVIKNALQLYEALIEHGDEHAQVVLRQSDGTTKLVRLFR